LLEERRALCAAGQSRQLRHQCPLSDPWLPGRAITLISGRVSMNIVRAILLSLLLAPLASPAHAQGKPAPKDAVLYFVWPQNGAVIKGGFWCRFGLRNMGVTHAGDNYPNAGHHHLFIDVN